MHPSSKPDAAFVEFEGLSSNSELTNNLVILKTIFYNIDQILYISLSCKKIEKGEGVKNIKKLSLVI